MNNPLSPAFAFAFMIAAAAATPAIAQSLADQWELGDLYPSAAEWHSDAARLESQITAFGACKGHLGDSARRLDQCLHQRFDMVKRLQRLAVYASEQLAADTGNAASLELDQQADLLGARLDEGESFLKPEILRIGKRRVDRFLAQAPSLGAFRQPLGEILRAGPHTLDKSGESLLAQVGILNHTGRAMHSTLTNADIPWPMVTLSTGEEVRLDPAGYTRHREARNRDDRKRVMDAFFMAFKTYERSLGVALYSQLKEDAVQGKVRKYPDSLTRAVDERRVPIAVMDTLIAQSNANLPTLHRYFRLRARMLGVTQMQYFDIYPPLIQADIKFPLHKAKQMTLEAVAPLGPEYAAALAKGFDSRWMDAYPRPRKQSGAHMAGDAYDVHPYVLMNYNGDYESVTTLAHEWGHAMHSYLANRTQPFATAGYAIFVAEIASTLNEQLLLRHVLKSAANDQERLLYLGSALEGLRGTFFRQAMFAEFERVIHSRVDAGQSVTGESLTRTYCDILKRYHGVAQGVMAIDDAYCVEWAYIPHFYNGFYVYQYATSIAASSLFTERIVAGEPGALKHYLDLLRAGGSGYPYELVKSAGVDLAQPDPYRAIVARMNAVMDEIEQILGKRNAGP